MRGESKEIDKTRLKEAVVFKEVGSPSFLLFKRGDWGGDFEA